jgi:hypothetical protein
LDEDDDVEGGDDSNDMGNQISKLKKIFNQDMPKVSKSRAPLLINRLIDYFSTIDYA